MKKIILILTIIYSINFGQDKVQILEDSLSVAKTKDEKIAIYLKITTAYIERDNLEKAENIVNILRRYKLKLHQQIQLHRVKGDILSHQFKYMKSLEYYNKALKLYSKTDDSTDICKLYNSYGINYASRGIYGKGLEYFLKAMKYSKEPGRIKAKLYNNIAVLYVKMDENDKALEYYEKALTTCENKKDSTTYGRFLRNIGEIYYKQKKYAKAKKAYLRAAELLTKNKRILAIVYYSLCELYLEIENNLNEAKKYYEKAKNVNYSDDMIKSLENFFFGRILIAKGNFKEGIKLLHESLKFSEKARDLSFTEKNYKKLYEIYKDRNDYKNLLIYYKKYTNFRDSIYNLNINDKIVSLEEKYETQRKTLEITQKTYEIIKERYVTYIFATFGFLILLIFLIFIFRLTKSNKIIKAKNDMLEDINTSKDKMFSVIGHDLRGPFNAIIGVTEIIKNDIDNLEQEELSSYISILSNSVEKAVKYSDNLLNWAMSQSGSLKIDFKTCNIKDITEEVLTKFKDKIKQKELVIENKISCEIDLYIDKYTISIVLQNIIDNAIKFSDFNDKIELFSEVEESKCIISIKDYGKGIEAEGLSEIFNLKKVNEKKNINEDKGTGLGLILCKEFVEKNNGEISIKSEVGKGTTLSISLSLQK